jgi:hypothetical protein
VTASISTIGVSMYDNGANSMKQKQKSTRFKANLSLTYFGSPTFHKFPVSFSGRRRDFKNTLPEDLKSDPWYDGIIAQMDFLVEEHEKVELVIDITAGKLRDANNHVIAHSAVVIYQVAGEFPVAVVYIEDFFDIIVLDLPPKGKDKCVRQIAFGQYSHPKYVREKPADRSSGRTFLEVMAAQTAKRS